MEHEELSAPLRPGLPSKVAAHVRRDVPLAFLDLGVVFVAYLAIHTVFPGATYRHVFRVVGCAAFLAYGIATLSNGIWKSYPWKMVLFETFDGLIYSALTAGTFGWLWPR